MSDRIPFYKNKAFYKKSAVITLITLKWIFIVGILCGFAVGGVTAGYVASLVKDDPVRTKDFIMSKINENAVTGFIYFGDDTVIGQLRSEEDRRLIDLNEIPQHVKDAFLAIEDNNFYEHFGIDVKGLFRAVKQQVFREEVQTGGSTITQQLARRVFLTLERSVERKAKELFLSLRMERLMSKDEILWAYLTKIHFGNGANGYNVYGVKAAAKGIFDIDDLNELNIAQAAYLAGLPQLPGDYSAFTGKGIFDPEGFSRAKTRQELVLKRMLEENKISPAQYEEALRFDLRQSLAESQNKAYNTYPYLMLEAEKEATEILLRLNYPEADTMKTSEYNEAMKESRDLLLRGGYHIYTTIDKTMYDEMRKIAENKDNFSPDHPEKGVEQIGAIMLDNKTGAILGMIEGRDFYLEQMNHATQAMRQPGSTMKTIAAFLPALESGAVQPASIIDDAPLLLKDGVSGFHIPENWDLKFHGLITARRAFNQSYNIPAIKIFLEKVGIEAAWDFARQLGITTIAEEDKYAQTGVIGGLTYGVTVKEMTGAYASIPNKGVFKKPYLIRKIVDKDGNVVYEHQMKPTTVYSEQTAYLMTDMMRTVISGGTGSSLLRLYKHHKEVPIVGKTGSTQDDADAWFIGFSPDITVGVWAGYEQSKHKLSVGYCPGPAGCGTQRAMTIFAHVMNAAVELKPELFQTPKFERPDNIVSATVSSVSGKLPSELTTESGKLVTDLFNRAYIPTEEDDVMVKARYVTYEQKNYLALPTTPDDMVKEQVVIKREKPIAELIQEIELVMNKIPGNRRKPLSHYYPLDHESDAPTMEDPRSDDGQEPAPPASVRVNITGEGVEVLFEESSSEDVAGYRIYRSEDGGSFGKIGVVLNGDPTIYAEPVPPGMIYGYYVTAVDVGGNESMPSNTVFTDGTNEVPPLYPLDGEPSGDPDIPPGDGEDSDGEPQSEEDEHMPPVEPEGPPSTPAGLTVESKEAGIVIRWRQNPRAEAVTQYEVYYSENENGPFRKLSTTKSNNLNYYALVYDGWYQVLAVNKNGSSLPSKPVHYQNDNE